MGQPSDTINIIYHSTRLGHPLGANLSWPFTHRLFIEMARFREQMFSIDAGQESLVNSATSSDGTVHQ